MEDQWGTLMERSLQIQGPGNPGSLPRCLIPSQRSSGTTIRTGASTKTGNTHARKALVSAAWKYTPLSYPRISVSLAQRHQHCSAETVAISQRAQKRLCKRYRDLIERKPPKVAVVALARELVGFLWEALQPLSTQTA